MRRFLILPAIVWAVVVGTTQTGRRSACGQTPAPRGEAATARGGTVVAFEASRPRRRFAVCVGVDGYAAGSGYGPLEFAGNDAIGVADALLTHCEFEHVLLLTDAPIEPDRFSPQVKDRLQIGRQVWRNAIRERIESFIVEADCEDDVVVFYFAGHGDLMKSAGAVLVAADYDREAKTGQRNFLPLSDVFGWLVNEPVRARNRLFMFDACRTGATGRGQRMSAEFLGVLARPEQDLTILSACRADQYAWEAPELRHGRFGWALIEGLSGKAFRSPDQTTLTSVHVLDYIREQFRDRGWIGDQEPQLVGVGMPLVIEEPAPPALAPAAVQSAQRGVQGAATQGAAVQGAGADVAVARLQNDFIKDARAAYRRSDLDAADESYVAGILISKKSVRRGTDDERQLGRLIAERARTLYRLGKPAEAKANAAAAEARTLCADAPALDEVRGYRLQAEGKFAEAADAFGKAIAGYGGDDANVSVHLLAEYGVALNQTKRFAEAAALFEKAAVESIGLKQLDVASRRLEQAAECYRQSGNLDGALELISRALELERQARGEDRAQAHRSAAFLDRTAAAQLAFRQLDDARKTSEAAVAMRKELGDTARPEFSRSLAILGTIQVLQRDARGQSTLLLSQLVDARRNGELDSNRQLEQMSNLAGTILHSSGQGAEAPAVVSASLEDQIDKFSDQLIKLVESRNETSLSIGEFGGRIEGANYGPGLVEMLRRSLETKRPGIVRRDAELVVAGSYGFAGEGDDTAVRLKLDIATRGAERVTSMSAVLTGNRDLAQIAGVTASLPPDASRAERNELIRQSLEKPQTTIAGAEVRAGPDTPLAVEIRAKPKGDGKYVARPATSREGQAFVNLGSEERFEIVLHNRSKREVAATITIDGLSVFAFSEEVDPKTGKPRFRHYLIGPGQTATIDGWHRNMREREDFQTTSYAQSAAGVTKPASDELGAISVAFAYTAPPASRGTGEVGTGIGSPIATNPQSQPRAVETPHEFVTIRYKR